MVQVKLDEFGGRLLINRTNESESKPKGILYVVATPMGNLGDLSPRALGTLRQVSLIAAEDTRQTKKLLTRFEINTPLTSFHQHSREAKLDFLIERLLEGDSIALVTDSGTPCISDPGANLVAQAHAMDISVSPIPGPNAVIAALSVAGFWSQRFRFEGFPPRKAGELTRFFERILEEDSPVVLYESPYRLLKTLRAANSVLGDRPLVVCRELTKQFEQVFRGTISEAIALWEQKAPKGEFTLVLGPAPKVKSE